MRVTCCTEWTELPPSCSTGGFLMPSARSTSCSRPQTTWWAHHSTSSPSFSTTAPSTERTGCGPTT
eukprot:7894691-Pyramimonas_sp.AAC.1